MSPKAGCPRYKRAIMATRHRSASRTMCRRECRVRGRCSDQAGGRHTGFSYIGVRNRTSCERPLLESGGARSCAPEPEIRGEPAALADAPDSLGWTASPTTLCDASLTLSATPAQRSNSTAAAVTAEAHASRDADVTPNAPPLISVRTRTTVPSHLQNWYFTSTPIVRGAFVATRTSDGITQSNDVVLMPSSACLFVRLST